MAGTDKAAELYAFVTGIQYASGFFVFNCSIIYGGSNRY